MIKSLSSYYLNIPWISPLTSTICVAYTLRVYVWDGLKASPPVTASYTMTKDNLANSSGTDKLDISQLINDYIDFEPNGNNQRWVKTTVTFHTTNEDDWDIPQLPSTNLMLQGYGGGLDGENAQPPVNNVLISGNEFKVFRNGYFNLPVLISESITTSATVKSYPSLNINDTITFLPTTNNANLVKNILVDLSLALGDEVVEVIYNDVIITLLVTDECRYLPLDIAFQNKEGALQFITFFKAKTESLTVTSEEFQTDRGQAIDGFHQMAIYNVQGNSKFKMNSGFVDESINETMKQLFLSERVWQFDGANYIPLKLGSKSLEYKTRMKDRLINYEVEFEYAFNEINNQ